MKVQGLLWDCDGVLVDSEPLCQQGWVEVLNEEGHSVTLEWFVRQFVGYSSSQAIEALGLPSDTYPRIRTRIHALFREHLKASPGIHEVLSSVPELKHAVASNASLQSLELELRLTGLWDFFSGHVYSAQQVEHGKPAPDVFLLAAQHLGLAPEACVVIEDSPHGVKAGRAAGMRVIGYTGGSHCTSGHAGTLIKAGAESTLADLRDLKSLL